MSDTETMDRAASEASDLETRVAALLAMVGRKVRQIRSANGLSRRVLSERSGVSQRYLAQLEGGRGNISIALLMRIADALGTRMEVLVQEQASNDGERGDLSAAVERASAEQRAQIAAILDPGCPSSRAARRIALIGLRGAGKSTLGALAAHKLGIRFLELNAEIERASGIAIDEVIELYGQEGYRTLEFQALEHVAKTHEQLVLAVAGGIVSQPDAFDYLLRNYHTIWLKAAPEEHMDRVRAQGDERPMAGNPDAMDDLRRILENREAHYARASVRLDTTSASLDDTLDRLLEIIEDRGFLSN